VLVSGDTHYWKANEEPENSTSQLMHFDWAVKTEVNQKNRNCKKVKTKIIVKISLKVYEVKTS